ncbi:hypothetical protein MMC28_005288 [Mycoblastus sanguinarius]|nr:hypothetical protein [Mycoblastus sanguinarius]
MFPRRTPTFSQQCAILQSLQGKELEACYHYDHRHNRIDLIFTDGTHVKLTHRYPYWNEQTMGPEPRVEMDDYLRRFVSTFGYRIAEQHYRDPHNYNAPPFTFMIPLRTTSIRNSLKVNFELLPQNILSRRWPEPSEVHVVIGFQFGGTTSGVYNGMRDEGFVHARREDTSAPDTIIWEDVMIEEVPRAAGTPNGGGMPAGGGLVNGGS